MLVETGKEWEVVVSSLKIEFQLIEWRGRLRHRGVPWNYLGLFIHIHVFEYPVRGEIIHVKRKISKNGKQNTYEPKRSHGIYQKVKRNIQMERKIEFFSYRHRMRAASRFI